MLSTDIDNSQVLNAAMEASIEENEASLKARPIKTCEFLSKLTSVMLYPESITDEFIVGYAVLMKRVQLFEKTVGCKVKKSFVVLFMRHGNLDGDLTVRKIDEIAFKLCARAGCINTPEIVLPDEAVSKEYFEALSRPDTEKILNACPISVQEFIKSFFVEGFNPKYFAAGCAATGYVVKELKQHFDTPPAFDVFGLLEQFGFIEDELTMDDLDRIVDFIRNNAY